MKNDNYWNTTAPTYLDVWERYSHRKKIHQFEKAFIQSAIETYQNAKQVRNTYLDLGCGPGRIIAFILETDHMYKNITGIDGSSSMITIAKERFRDKSNLHFINENITLFQTNIVKKVNVVTCIRVLKYMKDRKNIFQKVASVLTDEGIFICTVTNTFSFSYFDVLYVKHYKDSISVIRKQLKEEGLEIQRITGFQKLPEFIYIIASMFNISRIVFVAEKLLVKIFGEMLFARTLYILAQKKQ